MSRNLTALFIVQTELALATSIADVTRIAHTAHRAAEYDHAESLRREARMRAMVDALRASCAE